MQDTFKFYTDSFEIKAVKRGNEEQYYIEGYISTSDLDRVGDIITKSALQDMVKQIKHKNIKLDVEHEAWTKSSNLVPIGRIINAKLDDKGIFVKAILNKHVSRFQEIWNSVSDGFIDAFSIAYKAIKTINKKIGDKTVRILDKVELLNVALTGNPANPECKIAEVMVKSLNELEQTDEVENMSDDKEVKNAEETAQPEATVVEEAAPVEAPVVEAEAKSLDVDLKALGQTIEQLREEVAELKKLRSEGDTEVKALLKKLEAADEALSKPQLKHKNEQMPQEAQPLPKTALDLIR